MELVTISERDSMTASIQGSMMSCGIRDSKDSFSKLQSISVLNVAEVG